MLDERELLNAAKTINETLHAASINKDDRASVVASILLTLAQGNMPKASLAPSLYVDQINISALSRLTDAGKGNFAEHIAVRLPAGADAQKKYVNALVKTADALRHINISAAMRSGTDVLGEFYEAFLKYGNGVKDLGIVLTPRHITRWAAELMPLGPSDVVFDPTAGTGGFLVSAYDRVRSTNPPSSDFEIFRKQRIFGIEQQPKVAALAVIDMIFRGDGAANIIDDDALRRHLTFAPTENGSRSAEYRARTDTGLLPGATRVLMNPPFALKSNDEREYRFVEHALHQTVDGGLVFAVLPSPVMVKSGAPRTWRRDRLLPEHTLRAVVAFPEDLFYPEVSIDTVGVVIEKGRPHVSTDEVVWALCPTDGYAKVKGRRLRSRRVADLLSAVAPDVMASILNQRHSVSSIPGLIRKCPIDTQDELCELLPQVYLDEPTPTNIDSVLQHAVREYFAFLIRTASESTVFSALSQDVDRTASETSGPGAPDNPTGFKLFALTDLFGQVNSGIHKGSIHSLNVEDYGGIPVVSSSTENNGIMGFYDLDATWPRFENAISIASNSTPLTSFYHPYEFVPKDDVFVCIPPKEFPLETIFYSIVSLNSITWRFSYYRKAYLNKLGKISIYMPINSTGDIDHAWIKREVEACVGWQQLKSTMARWQPSPFVSLGKRPKARALAAVLPGASNTT